MASTQDQLAPFFPNSHQELSLYAFISASRLPSALKHLSGLTGAAAEAYFDHHLIYKPKPLNITPGMPQPGLYYLQLVSRVPANAADYDPRKQRWCIRLDDMPEVTRKPVISRNVLAANTASGDVIAFMDALGYTLQAAYFTDNRRFVHGNVVLTIQRVLVPASDAEKEKGIDVKVGECAPLPRAEDGYIMTAVVRVANATDVASVEMGVTELRVVREALRGVCDLEVVERLALDARVKEPIRV